MKMRRFFLAAVILMIAVLVCGCGGGSVEIVEGTDERVADAYREGAAYYNEQKQFNGFWDVSAAYACLGDEIYGRTVNLDDENENQRGAKILSLMMVGKNPYDVQGVDLVAELLEHGADGSFSIPVFNFLALQAAGAEMDAATEKAYVDYCCEQLTKLEAGPDIGGWAAVALVRYVDHEDYKEQIAGAVQSYIDVVGEDMVAGSMGSGGITSGCVVHGLTAFTAAGLSGCNPLADSPWKEQDPIALMYENLTHGEEHVSDYYKAQYYLEFADLYRVIYTDEQMAWLRCGISEERLNALLSQAEAFAGDPAVDAACAAALALTPEERSAAIPAWGRVYYDLYDAVNAASK